MRLQNTTAAALLLVTLAGAACSEKEGHAAPPGTAQAPAPSAPAAPPLSIEAAAVEEALLSPDAAVPTQEEADREAMATIDESNADAELEKLKQELGGG